NVLVRLSLPSLPHHWSRALFDWRRARAQYLLIELANRGFGDLIDESNLVGQPPFRDPVFEELDHLLLRHLAFELGLGHGESDRALVPLWVDEADHGRLHDLGVGHDRVLELDG